MRKDSTNLGRRQLLRCLAVAGSASLAGCAQSGDSDDIEQNTTKTSKDSTTSNPQGAETGGTLTVLITEGNFQTMDPMMADLVQDRQVMYNVFSGLLRLTPNLEIEGDLANSWEFVDDQTLHMELRKDAVFHTGDDVTSEDVKFSIERIMNNDSSTVQGQIGVVDTVETDGDYAIDIYLNALSVPLESNLSKDMASGCIVPQSYLNDVEREQFAREPIGSGPFEFVSWEQGNELRLQKNTDYYKNGQPKVDELVLQPVTDESTQLAAIQSGDAHLLNRGIHQHAKSLRNNPDINYYSKPGGNVAFMSFNHTISDFQNRNLRRAISMGINREALNTTTLYGEGWPARHAIPPVFDWAYSSVEDKPYTRHNPDKAQQLLQEEGYEGFEFELLTYDEAMFADGAQVMANQLRQIGLNPTVEIVDINTLIDHITNTNFEMLYAGIIGQVDPDMVYSLHHSEGIYNSGQYSNEELDSMIEEARTITDTSERGDLYKEIERVLVNEVPVVWTLHRPNTRVAHQAAQGYTHIPSNALPLERVSLR